MCGWLLFDWCYFGVVYLCLLVCVLLFLVGVCFLVYSDDCLFICCLAVFVWLRLCCCLLLIWLPFACLCCCDTLLLLLCFDLRLRVCCWLFGGYFGVVLLFGVGVCLPVCCFGVRFVLFCVVLRLLIWFVYLVRCFGGLYLLVGFCLCVLFVVWFDLVLFVGCWCDFDCWWLVFWLRFDLFWCFDLWWLFI